MNSVIEKKMSMLDALDGRVAEDGGGKCREPYWAFPIAKLTLDFSPLDDAAAGKEWKALITAIANNRPDGNVIAGMVLKADNAFRNREKIQIQYYPFPIAKLTKDFPVMDDATAGKIIKEALDMLADNDPKEGVNPLVDFAVAARRAYYKKQSDKAKKRWRK